MASIRVRIIIAVVAGCVGILTAGDPAWAQFAGAAEPDLSGSWLAINDEDFNSRGGEGPLPSDYTGLPLTDEGRTLALSTPESRFSMIERQCALLPPHYLAVGPFGLKISAETDLLTGSTVGYRIGAWLNRMETVIWLDGRPHPSENAPHMRSGFETGQWRGNTLTTHTTHMKGGIVRRNGAQVGDQATATTHYLRHGDLLTVVSFIADPIYFSEPMVVSRPFRYDYSNTLPSSGAACTPGFEGVERYSVPHTIPEENPMIGYLFKTHGIPREAQMGGAETMYPEFRKKLKNTYVQPEKCPQDCGGAGPPLGFGAPGGPGGPPAPGGAPPPAPGAPPPR